MATRKPPTGAALAPLWNALEAARQAVVDACNDLDMPLDLGAVARTFAAWVQAAEAWNDTLDLLATQVRAFISDHSDQWIASATGEAYAAWSEALAAAQLATEPRTRWTCTSPSTPTTVV